MAEKQPTQTITPEEMLAIQKQIFDDRNSIIDRLMPHFFEEDSLPACSEATKYLSAYFITQLIEGHRMSGSTLNPDVILDAWFEGFKVEVMNIHSQILMSPAIITAEDLKKVH